MPPLPGLAGAAHGGVTGRATVTSQRMEIVVIRKALILLVLSLVLPAQALAQTQHSNMLLKEHSLNVRISQASFDYEAGSENIDGLLIGPSLTYTYHDAFYPLMYRGEAELLFGITDYENGVSANSREILFNARGLVGHDVLLHDNLVLTPYTGLGLRYWSNNVHSSDARDQSQTYVYIPLGVETQSSLMPSVDFGTRMELDLLVDGSATSDFGGSNGRQGEAINDLDFGYGLRLSAYIMKQFEAVGLGLEPFIRYWNVNGSDGDWVRNPDAAGATPGFENYNVPHSTTFIWGASIIVQF